MHIDSFKDTVKSCRFCFMCRHLSGTANVTFRESDTPRVRAAMLDAVLRDPGKLSDPDLIETLYRCDLSGACTFILQIEGVSISFVRILYSISSSFQIFQI